MNQRMPDLPPSASTAKLSLFLYNGQQRHTGMSGAIRRKFTPFLWVAMIGLAGNTVPDNDLVVQACLSVSSAIRNLLRASMGPEFFHRTRAETDDGQKKCFEAGKTLAEAFYENISTKHHRFMYHVVDHLTSSDVYVEDLLMRMKRCTKRRRRHTRRQIIIWIQFQLN